VRHKVRELTDPNRSGVSDVRVVIRDLNPVLRGWGNYFRTGNAPNKLSQVDRYVEKRLRHLMRRRYGRSLRPDHREAWTSAWFRDQACIGCEGPCAIRGLHSYAGKTIGKPCAGKPHVRLKGGWGNKLALRVLRP
jgi:hypothetical protein